LPGSWPTRGLRPRHWDDLPPPVAGVAKAALTAMKFVMLTLACLAAASLVTASSRADGGEFSPKDGQVLGRTLGFVGDGMSGIAVVGIVFAPTNPASRQEAELILAVIGDDMPAGRVQLRGRLVPLGQLSDVIGIQALYVTEGLAGSMDLVFGAAQRLHVPTISADIGCVQSGACVVGFSSEPTVQIIIDRGAAERTGARFQRAFRMLVREK